MKNWVPQDALKFLGIGLQMAVTLLAGVFTGYFLDRSFKTTPVFTLTGSAVGFVLSLVTLILQVRKTGKDD